MSHFSLSTGALRDVRGIWDYIAEDSSANIADSVLGDLFDAMEMLARHPEVGHARPDIADPALRVWCVHRYLIVYWPEMTPLGIARVVHGHRDVAKIDFTSAE